MRTGQNNKYFDNISYKSRYKRDLQAGFIFNPITLEAKTTMIYGFQQLVMDIKEYESDTFSASGAKITEAESEAVANELVSNWASNHLDGVQIDIFLDKVRGL